MILLFAALASADATTPPVAFKSTWKFGLNLISLAIVFGLSLALMAGVYVCERSYTARNTRHMDGVPPVFPAHYQINGLPLAGFAHV
jgi:hypothetical protein